MSEDKELEELKRRKLEELLRMKQQEPAVSAANVVEVTDQNFTEFTSQRGLVVVDCWAPWCAPCRMIAPIIEGLAKDYAGRIIFGKLNVDENIEVPTKYQIMSIPTILVFKNGDLVDRIVGGMARKIMEQRITRHL
ncbi:MAG: thioredoxin [Candidatus Bathyarchaeia archaeon]|nr:thioredoxin [Candidatus Bathyarchaeota archaeon]